MESREYPTRPVVAVGGVVVNAGRVLLVRRGHEPLLGEWSIPGGGVEVGERLTEAVEREIREETGFTVAVYDVVEVLDRIIRDQSGTVQFHYVLVDYACSIAAGSLQAATDAVEARWVLPDELSDYRLRPETLRVVEKGLAMTRP
jgi:8-oxo-dGTP diphosphatase